MQIIAMDHTHCITCGRELTKRIANIETTRSERLYGNFPEFRGWLTGAATDIYLDRLRSFNQQIADQIVAGIPRDWLIGDEIQNSLKEFLTRRAVFVSGALKQKLIDWGGLEGRLELFDNE